jgi:hypothetical protein
MLGTWRGNELVDDKDHVVGRVAWAFDEWTGWLKTGLAPAHARARSCRENSAFLHSWYGTADEAKAAIERGAVEGCEDTK